jgi:hypothetical protein
MFENWQWRVTDYGIEAIRGAQSDSIEGVTPTYEIEAKRLLETTERGNEELYDWLVHMAEKTWVDIAAFTEAFEKALAIHADKYEGQVDPKMLQRSIAEAWKEARKR